MHIIFVVLRLPYWRGKWSKEGSCIMVSELHFILVNPDPMVEIGCEWLIPLGISEALLYDD